MRFQVNRATLVDPQILELERRRIFDVCWIYVGHESEVRAPGRLQDAHRLRPAGHLLPRQQEPGPRLPQHLPPPRQHRLPRGRGQREEPHLLLPRLELQPRRRARRACPGEDAYPPSFRKSDFALKEPPHVASYRGFVFLNFDPNAVPLEDYLAGAKEYIDLIVDQSPSGQMEVIQGLQDYDIRANWKLLAENSFDDYHLISVHALVARLPQEFRASR